MSAVGAPAAGPALPPEILSLARNLLAAKYYMLAAFTMYIYDLVLTFDIEVERIWQQPWSGATVLYLLNRYLVPLEYVVVVVSFHLKEMSVPAVCDRFVRFAGAGTTASTGIIEIILILRTYALYGRSKTVLALLCALFLGELAVMAFAIANSGRVRLPPGFIGCILVANKGFERVGAAFWIAPMIFEAIIFALTLGRTIFFARKQVRFPLLTLILRDGALYFFIIVVVNLINVLLFLLAPPDLQAINVTFSQLVTSLLISHLMLNLKSPNRTPVISRPAYRTKVQVETESEQSFFTKTIGNLGAPLRSDNSADHDVLPRAYPGGYDHQSTPPVPLIPQHYKPSSGAQYQGNGRYDDYNGSVGRSASLTSEHRPERSRSPWDDMEPRPRPNNFGYIS